MDQQRDEEARVAALSREVLDRLLEGCQVVDFAYRYLYLNDSALVHARTTRDALLGRTMSACFPGIEATPMFAALRRCLEGRRHEHLENEFEFADGTRTVFDLRFVPVPQGACILSLDLTERRHQLAAIVHDSEDAILSRSLDGVITSWNRGAERMFGFTAAEVIGQRFERLFPQHAAPPSSTMIARFASGERIPPFEAVRLHKDGHQVEVSITLSPYRNLAGDLVGVSMIARDITELKRVQRELVRAVESAQAANRELEAFAYSVAHDLRAPLRRIDAFSHALAEDCADSIDARARKHIATILGSTQVMATLIDDILKLSLLAQHELEPTPLDLSALARATVARLQLAEPHRAVDVVIEPGLTARGDGRLLGLALDNLLGNAWKFTARRDRPRIELGKTAADGEPGYFVRDNGAGFDMAHAHQLFAPFKRLHSTAEFEGTGIGLATVQRIIQRHGGRVWATGEVGHGATFYFTLGDDR